MSWALLVGAIVVAGVLLYWLLIVTEGVYLGANVVAMLYNWVAQRYDSMKAFSPAMEEVFLTRPLISALRGHASPLVLDVATGTGRVPALLLAEPTFTGRVFGLDFAREMLALAAGKTMDYGDRVTYIWQNAMQLPFLDASFDLVTCLEALEFMPDPEQVLREIVRVVRPGAMVFLTHRRGWESKLMPGKCWPEARFRSLLEGVGLRGLEVAPWQKDYSLVCGRTGAAPSAEIRKVEEGVLCCLNCSLRPLERLHSGLRCLKCDAHYAIAADGIIEMAATRRPRRRQ
jgi:ubiquinone/menaquinone biosynthesis C-methylase UbiE